MRDWKKHRPQLHDAGGRLVVVTSDDRDALDKSAKANNIHDLTYAIVEPERFERLGLRNPDKPRVPIPGTFIVAPDGTIIWRSLHPRYRKRADPFDAIEVIRAHRETGAVAPADDTPTEQGPDWDSAVTVDAQATDDGVLVRLKVAEGFHVYGRKEKTSIPIDVTVRDVRSYDASIPRGTRKQLGIGTAWVLEGEVEVPVKVTRRETGPLHGALLFQVCTDDACSPPAQTTWRTD